MITTMKKTAIFLLTLMLAITASAQTTLRTTVRQLQGHAALRGATWGVLAVRLGGDTLAAYNADRRLVPASNVKVITAGTALHALGADWRFRTDLAYSGRIVDGVLQGDLYIVGGGDPTTASKYDCAIPTEEMFAQWKEIIDAAGIRAIEGTIVGDGRGWGGRIPLEELYKIQKGVWVKVVGRNRTRKYTTQNGEERTTTDIIAHSVEILPREDVKMQPQRDY